MKGQTLTPRRTPLKTVFSVLTAVMIAVVLLPFMKPQKAEAATTYKLWIMGTQVTSTNENDITGGSTDAKFTFDHNTNTVHVTARGNTTPVLYVETGSMEAPAIFRSYMDEVTLSIDCKNIKFVSQNADVSPFFVYGKLTITGDGKLEIDSVTSCICVQSFTADHANISLKGTIGIDNYGDYTDNIIFNSSTITADLSDYFIDNYLEDKYYWHYELKFYDCHISDPANGGLTWNYGPEVTSRKISTMKYYIKNSNGVRMNDFTISPDTPPVTVYDGIKVCGKEVNSANKDDIMGGGEFSYDPDTKTLNIKKSFNKVIDGYPSVIENTGIDGLIINTTGTNCTLSNQSDDYSSPCISISRNTTFKGNRLIVNGNIYGIKVNGSAALTFSSPANAYANDYGIFGSSSASVTFNGSPITAEGEIAAVKGFKTITISDSVAVRDMAYYISNGIRAGRRSSSPYATSVTFVKNESYDLWVNGQQVRTSNINDILGDGTSDSHPFGTMWFAPSSLTNMLVLDANGRELNVNKITSRIPNLAIVVMSDTNLVPNSPTVGQIDLYKNTRITGEGKLTVNNISAYNCNISIEGIDNLAVGDPSKSSSSFLVVNGTGNISIEDSNVYVKGALRSENGYINFDKSYIAAPQDAVVKSYKSSSYNYKNAVCIGDELAHQIRIYREGTKPEFKTNSMTLGGSISLNFYTDLSKLPSTRYADSYVEFVVNGKKQTAKFDPNKMNKAKTYYGFNCKLNSISMADPVTAILYYYDSNGNKQCITTTSSAEDYLRKFNEQLDGGTKTWDLIKGINDYGYYMQQYLSGLKTTTWKLGVDHKAMEKAFATHAFYTGNKSTYISELKGMAKSFGSNKNIQKVNYSLVLDSDTSINFKFKKADGYNGKFTVTVDGKSATPKKLTDGRFQVSVTGIPAHKLNEPHTVKVTTDSGTTTYKASALSYIYECINKPNSDSEYDAMSAMYEYYKAAVAYNA